MKTLNTLFKLCLTTAIMTTLSFAVETKNIDEGFASVKVKNNKANIFNFPFSIKKATVIGQTPENFLVKVQGRNSVTVVPTAEKINEEADILITSQEDYTFIITVKPGNNERIFNFTSNKVQKPTLAQAKFESGKIDNDMKKILKSSILEKKVPGYKRMEIKRSFHTQDLVMQKDYILDGGKYRVEKWFLKNKNHNRTVILDEGNFYTNGILAIAFEVPKIPPKKISTMWLVINKSSLVEK